MSVTEKSLETSFANSWISNTVVNLYWSFFNLSEMEQHHQLLSHHRSSSSSSNSAAKMTVANPYMRSNSYNGGHAQAQAQSSGLSPYAHQMICLGSYCYPSSSWSHDPSPRNNNSSNVRSSSSTALIVPKRAKGIGGSFTSIICSILNAMAIQSLIIIPAACRWLTNNIISSATSALSIMASPICCTGTLFGHRKGHVYFAIQDNPRSEPLFLLELPVSTSALVKEMSSGLVRIALECDKKGTQASKQVRNRNKKLLQEQDWTMYCNSKNCGTARLMKSSDFAMFVLATIGSTSVGAGVIPMVSDGKAYDYGELMYMRARFERAAGNRDSEAFYMLNPDGNVGLPELSIFMLRL